MNLEWKCPTDRPWQPHNCKRSPLTVLPCWNLGFPPHFHLILPLWYRPGSCGNKKLESYFWGQKEGNKWKIKSDSYCTVSTNRDNWVNQQLCWPLIIVVSAGTTLRSRAGWILRHIFHLYFFAFINKSTAFVSLFSSLSVNAPAKWICWQESSLKQCILKGLCHFLPPYDG